MQDVALNPFGSDYVEPEDYPQNLVEVPGIKNVVFDGHYGAVPEIETDRTDLLAGHKPTTTERVTSWYSRAKTVTKDAYGVVYQKVESVTSSATQKTWDGELLSREQELAAREKTIRDKEASLGIEAKKPNWPVSFYPLAYHNIAEEIPERYNALVAKLYLCMLGEWACLMFNWAVVFLAVLSGAITDNTDSDALWATLYLMIGVPCAWKFWYTKAYNGSRDGSHSNWVTFFLAFSFHTAFCAYMALGVPGTASGGLFFMFKMISHSAPMATVLSCICTTLWGLEAASSVFLLKAAHAQWRNGGVSFDKDMELQVANVAADAIRSGPF